MKPLSADTELCFFLLFRDHEVMKYFGSGPKEIADIKKRVKSVKQRWLSNKFSWFVVFSRQTGSFIGACGNGEREDNGRSEFAYLILPEHWGNKYATEMVNALVRRNKVTVLIIGLDYTRIYIRSVVRIHVRYCETRKCCVSKYITKSNDGYL